MTGQKMKAKKNDGDKPPLELIPYKPMREVAKVLHFGRQKYSAWNWAEGFKWSRLIGALERHMGEFKDGQNYDKESGLHTLAHVGCCWLFLFAHQLYGLGEDDRYVWPENKTSKINKKK